MHEYSLRSAEYRDLTGNYDGYALYNQMSWTRASGTKPFSRGVLTEIPFRGYGGWVCNFDSSKTPNYSCVSRFVDASELDLAYPPNLATEQPSDRPDLY